MKVHSYQNEINNRNDEIRKLNMVLDNKENVLKQTAVAENLAKTEADKQTCVVREKDAEI